jgi:hypothetical protein
MKNFKANQIAWLTLALCLCSGCPKPKSDNSASAHFVPGRAMLMTRAAGDPNVLLLQDDFTFYDPAGKKWLAPKGTLTDGASIPQAFLSFTGGQLDAQYRDAAVLHDAYCAQANEKGPSFHIEKWEDVDRMFYNAMIVCGCDQTKAKLMYAAVYLGGPRWLDPQPQLNPSKFLMHSFYALNNKTIPQHLNAIPQQTINENLTKYRQQIQTSNLSLDQIDQLMDQAQTDLTKASGHQSLTTMPLIRTERVLPN